MLPVLALVGELLSLLMPLATGIGLGVVLALIAMTLLTRGSISSTVALLTALACIVFVVIRIRLLRHSGS
jgi:hypothetical protein